MRYLLDTHILLWAATLDKKLPSAVYGILQDADISVAYSVVCSWELVIKQSKGKIKLPKNFISKLPILGFSCLAIDYEHVNTLQNLPKGHGDPFDRMLAAQAKTENMTLITCDKAIAEYPIKTLLI